MYPEVLERFLSKDSILLHLSYLHTIRLKHSVNEKSIPEICGKSIAEITKMKLKSEIKSDILPHIISIKSHELYFDSFSPNQIPCHKIKLFYSSHEDFLYRIFLLARESVGGFVYIYSDPYGRPKFDIRFPKDSRPLPYTPLLSIDMHEHAFFSDYRFDSDRYIKALLPYLDLTRLFKNNT